MADQKIPERRRGRRFGDLGIQTKLGLAFGALLFLFAVTGYLYAISVQQVNDARSWAQHTQKVLVAVKDVMPPLLRQQSAMRGYLVTYDPSFLDPYEEGTKQFQSDVAIVRELVADNPQQQASIEQLLAKAQEWWKFQAELQALASATDKQLEIQERLVSGRGTAMINAIDDILRVMNDRELELLAVRNARLDETLNRTRQFTLAAVIAGGLFVLIVVLLVSRHIGQPLGALSGLMTRLAAGESGVEVPNQRRGDEVGALARGLEKFRIANADLSSREWIKTRLAELSMTLQACDSESAFAGALLRQVARDTDAVSGALFVLQDSGALELAGGYGVPDANYAARRFTPGEGLIGQVAADGQPRLIDSLPDDFFAMRTALGQSRPRMLYLLPLSGRERNVLGVLELSLFTAMSSRQKELLDAASSHSGLVLETLRSDLATRTLLYKTQKQGEELRAQEEELRSTNEILRDKQHQLEEQAQHLRASEEELRAQSEELRITNVQLEEKSQELSEQKAELERAQAALEGKALDLERASQYKSDFLANMSHELRTPLNSLLILAKGLADNEHGNLNDEQLESARIVYDSGKNLLALINDILDLSKIEAGKMEAVAEDFELKALLTGIERNFRPLAKERKLEFSVDVAADVPRRLRSDPGKISQIIINLLSNAFKFTHVGSVTLKVARPASGGANASDYVIFSVTDSGIGIEKSKVDRLFQAFEQGDSGTSRRYGGTGLGLSICRGLARLLGGEVSVSSDPGKGSTFSLLIPEQLGPVPQSAPKPVATATRTAVPSASAKALVAAETAPLDDGPAAMLIVEDDRQFAEVLAGMARGKGYRVLVANDGETAVRLAARHRLVGVLLDIGLPGMDGWDVMECLKDNPATRDVPVHFISGADEDGRARAAGAAGFLRKPVTQQQISGLLEALPPPGASTRRVLLIDDSARERLVVRELLRDEKVDIEECARAEEALEKMLQQSYDLIILDLGLPGMDGFEFLEVASKRGSMPPVVVHSGRELTREESMKLREYTDSVVLKSAPNTDRLLDEVTLFLHSIRRVAPTPEAPATRARTPAVLNGRTVLIVDDDMRNMFALSKALRSHGLKVMMAQDGPKALAQLENSPEISIVLMDIMMPGMDGYEVMQRIRAESKWSQLPMIAVTAKAMAGDREKCLAAGANDYCPKPIDIDQLVDQMARLLT